MNFMRLEMSLGQSSELLRVRLYSVLMAPAMAAAAQSMWFWKVQQLSASTLR